MRLGFSAFAFLWALSGLLDLAPFDAWFRSPIHAMHAAFCFAVLLRPSSLWAFGAMNLLRIASFAYDSPQTPNHQVLFAIASLAILVVAAVNFRARGLAGLTRESWLTAFAPTLRLMLVLVYVITVLHKLNRDYFDPAVTCAYHTLAEVLPAGFTALIGDAEGPRMLLMVGSLVAEMSIALLLCFSPTRRLGVAVGVLFHTGLGVRFYAFSTGVQLQDQAIFSCMNWLSEWAQMKETGHG